ncbi:MAG: ATP-dependent helicase HrpB [Gammaproteobacteria bacterium]|jgi:ATP-dependent helicase HrpB|nr:ATP-dependent helicase HrpB [Gammaproteobacteria bacterium]
MKLPELPISDVLDDITASLNDHHDLLIEAPPGAGKTTLVPLVLMDQEWLGYRKIIMLEPRRLAAKTAAHRMASLIGESPGQTIGYRMRLETRVSKYTKVEVVTEGVFARMLQSDPALQDVGLVIFDEFHERHLDSDMALATCLKMREIFRDEDPLRLIVMSATLDTQRLVELLDAPVVRSEGRLHPVDIIHGKASQPRDRIVDRVVETTLKAVNENPDSSLLVFLPGQGEITRSNKQLAGRLPGDVTVHPLFGNLTLAEQQAAIEPSTSGRKIVLATNIAETSLTIEGVDVVIDSGLAREPCFDAATGMTRLQTVRISAASATQRAGRAGRLRPGRCYRLWSTGQQDQLAPHITPEIKQADLTGIALQLFHLGFQSHDELDFLDAPGIGAWQQAVDLLVDLGALEADQKTLTDHGEAMAEVAAHPRLAHLLIRGAEVGALQGASCLAAILSDRNPLSADDPDLSVHMDILIGEHRCPARQRGWRDRTRRLADQLASPVSGISQVGIVPAGDLPGYLLACAYPDRIARKRHKGGYQLANGRSASFAERQRLDKHDWLAIAEVGGMAKSRGDVIRSAAPLNPQLFDGLLASRVTASNHVSWDKKDDRFIAESRRQIGSLMLSKERLADIAPEDKAACIVDFVRNEGLNILPFTNDVRAWQARVVLARTVDESLPDLSDDCLLETLEDWLSPYIVNVNRLADFKKLDLRELLRNLLAWPQQQRVDELVPERITVASGHDMRVDYSQSPPVLATKLQTMFGCRSTPTILNGTLPLKIHLLSPAGRPLQVTQDLETFWENVYPEVRKEMKGRYPKHPWPENPLDAKPTMRTQKKS